MSPTAERRRAQGWLAIVLAAYLVIGAQYALLTPAWQAPDEPAHYNYIRQLAQTGRLPRLEAGDYDQAYLETLTARRFPPGLPVEPLEYQDYQPPLFYVLAAPIYLAFAGALLPLRLFSLALGAGVVVFAYLAALRLAPARPLFAASAAAFLAFLPQFVAIMASVNNDSLSLLIIAAGLFLCLRHLSRAESRRGGWELGAVLGLAFITKAWAYVLAPAMALTLLLAWRRQGWAGWRAAAGAALRVFGPALLIGALYWGRNWLVCGPADFLCGDWHDRVVVGQPRTADWLAQYGAAGYAQRYAQTTFQSFWGQFGWMGVVMDGRVYQALVVFSAGLAVGAAAVLRRRWAALDPTVRDGLIVLGGVAAVTAGLYGYYNLSFVQFQGRYLFPALVPIAIAAAAGLWQWAAWLAKPRLPAGARAIVVGAPLAAMAALSLLALYRFILPQLAP